MPEHEVGTGGEDPTLRQGENPQAPAEVPEAGRQGILARTEQEGAGGFLRGLGSMLLPQAGLPGKRGLGNILNDFVEFGGLGDLGDIGAALDPNSGLDLLERLIAASPFLGIGAYGSRQTYRHYQRRFVQQQPRDARSMMPSPGEQFDFDGSLEDARGPAATAEQARERAAHYEQLALEANSPFSQSLLAADSWPNLAAAVASRDGQALGLDTGPDTLLGRTELALQQIGAAVMAIVPDPELYGSEFVAAKSAIIKWNRANELGIIDESNDLNTLTGSRGVENSVKIAQMEAALWMVGPDLSLASGARLSQIWWTDPKQEIQIGYVLVDGLLPTERGFDYDIGYPLDPEVIRRRQQQLDMEGMVGVGSTHVAQALLETPPHAGDSAGGLEARERMNWYQKENATARALAEITPYEVQQISGVLAALSASTPWIPDNLVGAVHVILQTGTDLVPGSVEYTAAFKQVTLNAGWGFDLFEDSSVEVQEQFEQRPGGPGGFPDVEGVTEFYADPENVTSPEGNLVGAADQTKKDKIDMILKGNLPPWIVLRGMKTNTFSQIGADPTLVDLVTIDVWNDRVWWGTRWVDTPLAHQGYTPKTQIEPNETYHDPISGDTVKGDVILGGLANLKEQHGWTDVQVERWTRLLTSYPTKTAQARFLAQAKSHLLVRDEFGLEAGHQAQAGSWGTAREMWDGLEKEIDAAQTKEELKEIAERGNLSTIMFSHLDGNPSMELTAAGMVWNLSGVIPRVLPTLAQLNATKKGMQRQASTRTSGAIIAISGQDGQVSVYADSSVNGVAETLRHATPSGVMVGKYELYLSSEPRTVTEVESHFKDTTEYTREDGRKAAGYQTMIPVDPEYKGHPGSQAGDSAVILLPNERVDEANKILDGDYGFDRSQVPAQGTVTGLSRNPVEAQDIENLTSAQLAEVLENNDWVTLSAFKDGATDGQNWQNQRLLKLELERAGGTVIDGQGIYGGTKEGSMFVTGITYEDAFFLGRKYLQESIATRSGLLFMDGTYRPVQDGGANFGEQVDPFNHTVLSTGQKFSFDYDSNQILPLPGATAQITMVSIKALAKAQNWTVDISQVSEGTLKQVKALAEKMKSMGQDAFWNNPDFPGQEAVTIAWRSNWNDPRVIDGAHRIEAAKMAGFTSVPVRLADKMKSSQWVPSKREADIRERLGMEEASNPEMEALADTAPEGKPLTQMTVGMGGQYGGATWNITDRVLKQLAAIPGARLRFYTHSQNKIPGGFAPVSESVVTDEVGVTGSTLHRNGDAYSRHQNQVYVPEWEVLTLSEDGFTGERTRRGTRDVRDIMEIDEAAGMIWIDKDVAIQVDPAAEVTMGKRGNIFTSLKVNGEVVRQIVVDTNGPLPIIAVGLDAIPAPGRTVVDLTRGKATKITPHGEGDWTAAKEALTSVGLLPDGVDVKVSYPEPNNTLLEDSTYRVTYQMGRGLESAEGQPASRPLLPEDTELTERLQKFIPKLKRANLGKNVHPELRGQLESVLEGLHGISDRFPGVALVGPIDPKVWRGSAGIDMLHIINEPNTTAFTGMNKAGGIVFNERQAHVRWNRGASLGGPGFMFKPDSLTDFESTVVHEMGHIASRRMHGGEMIDLVEDTMDEMGNVEANMNMSKYGMTENQEFIAEAFVEVMTKGADAHPALVELVRKVIES